MVSEPAGRKVPPDEAAAEVFERNRRNVSSEEGKALMGKRSELGERTFMHILNHGGMRRTTLSGHRNVYKRMLIAGLAFNLSIHSWHVHGVGTPKQALAGNRNPCPGRPRGPVAIPWGPMDAILGHLSPKAPPTVAFSPCLAIGGRIRAAA